MLGLIAAICGDMGTCVVYMMIFVVMAWSAGVKVRWFVLVGGGLIAAALILWFFILPDTDLWDSNYIIMRFRVVLDHSLDPQDKGFQQSRSILAIGSGQLFGQGLLHGIQTQADYSSALPARDTDFIFAVCGEELGMVGCLALLTLLFLIVLRCVWVSRPGQLPLLRLCVHGHGGDAAGPDLAERGHVPLCAARHGPDAPLHQLWRLVHHHPVCRHGHRLQREGANAAQLAAEPEQRLSVTT